MHHTLHRSYDSTLLLEHILRRSACLPLPSSSAANLLWCTSHPNVTRNKLEAALMRTDVPIARTFSQVQSLTPNSKPQTRNNFTLALTLCQLAMVVELAFKDRSSSRVQGFGLSFSAVTRRSGC